MKMKSSDLITTQETCELTSLTPEEVIARLLKGSLDQYKVTNIKA
jgi:hypothetical protein